MPVRQRLSPERRNVYYFLNRSRRFHANIGSAVELDVTELSAQIAKRKAAGEAVSFIAVLVKALSLVVSRHPRLNRLLFHGWSGPYEVQYPNVRFGLLVSKTTESGESLLFPTVIADAHQKSVLEIFQFIQAIKTTPLNQLEQYRRFAKLVALPSWLHGLLSYKLRSDHRFFDKVVGASCGMSSLASSVPPSVSITPTQTLSPYGCTFFPGTTAAKPVVRDGRIEIRQIFTLNVTLDHFLVDGGEGVAAVNELDRVLSHPSELW